MTSSKKDANQIRMVLEPVTISYETYGMSAERGSVSGSIGQMHAYNNVCMQLQDAIAHVKSTGYKYIITVVLDNFLK